MPIAYWMLSGTPLLSSVLTMLETSFEYHIAAGSFDDTKTAARLSSSHDIEFRPQTGTVRTSVLLFFMPRISYSIVTVDWVSVISSRSSIRSLKKAVKSTSTDSFFFIVSIFAHSFG